MSSDDRSAVFVSADHLRAEMVSGSAPVLLDVRWTLQQPDGRAAFAAGHIDGARYVDLESTLSDRAVADGGRHPLPDPDAVRAWAASLQIAPDTPVVVYDDWNGLAAARAWWVLRWIGARDVRLLDGGLAAWVAGGGEVRSAAASDPAGRAACRPAAQPPDEIARAWSRAGAEGEAMPTMTIDEAAAWPNTGPLLDTRAHDRYTGDAEPMDPRAGHIPGAVSVPTADVLDPDGLVLDRAHLRSQFAAVGVRPGSDSVGVYCGSGITAAHQAAVLASIGVVATLFPGSWSQWSADPTRPVATGPDAGRPENDRR